MDVLRLRVSPAPGVGPDGFKVEIFVNDVEVTSAGAGLGMDPYALLVPANRLVATETARRVPVARCSCGVYGCGITDATIIRLDGTVLWDWKGEVPMDRPVVFAAGAYDAEVARVGSDFGWETPERTAGRLVLTGVDSSVLAPYDLELDWVANHWPNPDLFRVALRHTDRWQIFVDVPWAERRPDALAAYICDLFHSEPPPRWRASWHPIRRTDDEPPTIAGPDWVRERF